MQISKKSWHYRFLYDFIDKPEYRIPHSLCPYVRMLAWYLFLTTAGVSFVVSLLISMGWSWYGVFFLPEGLELTDTGLFFVALGFVVQTVLGLGAFGWFMQEYGLDWIEDTYYSAKKKLRPPRTNFTGIEQPKTPNVFWEYLKARKKKLCPIIEFTE